MTGVTNRGKFKFLQFAFNAVSTPTNYYAALFTAANTPAATSSTRVALTEVAAGNGYTAGGQALAPNTTNFPGITQDDTNNLAKILVINLTWTASGGNLPSNSVGAAWMALCGGTTSSDDVYAFWNLGASRVVANTQALQVNQAEIDILDT
jgi:hypothetical protein